MSARSSQASSSPEMPNPLQARSEIFGVRPPHYSAPVRLKHALDAMNLRIIDRAYELPVTEQSYGGPDTLNPGQVE